MTINLFEVSADDVSSAFVTALLADTALVALATGGIFKGRAPANAPLPRVVVIAGPGLENQDSGHWKWTVSVESRASDESRTGVPDYSLLGQLDAKIGNTVSGMETLTKTGFRFFDVIKEISSGVLSEANTNESFLTTRYVVDCRNLAQGG